MCILIKLIKINIKKQESEEKIKNNVTLLDFLSFIGKNLEAMIDNNVKNFLSNKM